MLSSGDRETNRSFVGVFFSGDVHLAFLMVVFNCPSYHRSTPFSSDLSAFLISLNELNIKGSKLNKKMNCVAFAVMMGSKKENVNCPEQN